MTTTGRDRDLMEITRRLSEAFLGEEATLGEAPKDDEDRTPKKREDPELVRARNVPREFVSYLNKHKFARQMIWIVSETQKGTQSSRLFRDLEDTGWRRVRVGSKTLLYHGRSFRLMEPVREPPEWTMDGVYTLFVPLMTADPKAQDRDLLQNWGTSFVGVDHDELSVNRYADERFLSDIYKFKERLQGSADRFYQHTGIALDPVVSLGRGTRFTKKTPPRVSLPGGVDPQDIVLVADQGRMYIMRAEHASDEHVPYDSRHVLFAGRTGASGQVSMRYPAGDFGTGAFGKLMATRHGPDHAEDDDFTITGDGTVAKAVALAKKEGRSHIYVMARDPDNHGTPDLRIPTTPAKPPGKGMHSDSTQVAHVIRQTGGSPISAGKWEVANLGQYLDWLEHETGARL